MSIHVDVAPLVLLVKLFLSAFQPPPVLITHLCWTTHSLANFHQQLGSITLIRHVRDLYEINEVDAHHVLILLNLDCPYVQAEIFSSIEKLNSNYRWLLVTDQATDSTEERVLKLFADLPIFHGSQIYILADSEPESWIDIKRIYRNSIESDLILEEVLRLNFSDRSFNWTVKNPSVAISRQLTPGLAGAQVNASLVITHNDSLNHLTDYVDKHLDTISKVNFILTNDLIRFMNATVEYKVVSSWGYLNNETGQWDGMIGQLVRGEAHVGASALFFTADRVGTIQYLSMTTPTKSKFVFQAPKLSYTDNVFLLPFESGVWMSILGLIGVVVIILKLVTVADVHVLKYINLVNSGNIQLGWTRWDEIITIILGATCQQGYGLVPFSLASCIVVMVTFIALLFLYTSYAANIVALLQSPSSKIKSLDDLLHSRLKFGVDDTVFNRYYFSHQTEQTRLAIYKEKCLKPDGSMIMFPLEEGVNKIREGLFAFHMELGAGYKIVSETFFEHEKCTLKELQFYELIDPWYAIEQNSSLREIIKIALFRLREHGIQTRENDHLYTKKPVCQGVGGAFVTVGMVDIKPAVLVLLWGLLFSFLIFLAEFFGHRWMKKCIGRKRKMSGEGTENNE